MKMQLDKISEPASEFIFFTDKILFTVTAQGTYEII